MLESQNTKYGVKDFLYWHLHFSHKTNPDTSLMLKVRACLSVKRINHVLLVSFVQICSRMLYSQRVISDIRFFKDYILFTLCSMYFINQDKSLGFSNQNKKAWSCFCLTVAYHLITYGVYELCMLLFRIMLHVVCTVLYKINGYSNLSDKRIYECSPSSWNK